MSTSTETEEIPKEALEAEPDAGENAKKVSIRSCVGRCGGGEGCVVEIADGFCSGGCFA